MAVAETFLALLVLLVGLPASTSGQYKPTWQSLDTRPLPAWYDEAKFGIFITWGVYSVPAYGPYGSVWFWYWWRQGTPRFVEFMKKNYPPNFTYADFAPQFTAEFYDPDHWADIIEASGARYTVLVTKHHDGFTLWPSKASFNWNAMDVGPKRDLVGDFAKAIRKKKDIHLGLYHSLFEFYNPLFLEDQANKFKTRYFIERKTIPELYELVNWYQPDIVWSDGHWMANSTYWQSKEFLAWLYNDSPVKDRVVVNDRWGTDATCKHGDFLTCHDGYKPGHLVRHKWEDATTVERDTWGYARNANLSSFFSAEELIRPMVEVFSCGGNVLLNIGPTHDGRITPIDEERLRQVGSWFKVNGEAVYSTKPWIYQNDSKNKGIWYTAKISTNSTTDVYAFVLDWPTTDTLELGDPIPTQHTTVTLLGYPTPFKYTARAPQGMIINIPVIPFYAMPCQWAWAFKITYLKNSH